MSVPEGAHYDESTPRLWRCCGGQQEGPWLTQSSAEGLQDEEKHRCVRGSDWKQAMPSDGNAGIPEGEKQYARNGQPLTRPRFVLETQKALRRRGLSAVGYSGHSFRSEAATTAAAAQGVGEATIKMLGRLSSTGISGVYQDPKGTPGTSGSACKWTKGRRQRPRGNEPSSSNEPG